MTATSPDIQQMICLTEDVIMATTMAASHTAAMFTSDPSRIALAVGRALQVIKQHSLDGLIPSAMHTKTQKGSGIISNTAQMQDQTQARNISQFSEPQSPDSGTQPDSELSPQTSSGASINSTRLHDHDLGKQTDEIHEVIPFPDLEVWGPTLHSAHADNLNDVSPDARHLPSIAFCTNLLELSHDDAQQVLPSSDGNSEILHTALDKDPPCTQHTHLLELSHDDAQQVTPSSNGNSEVSQTTFIQDPSCTQCANNECASHTPQNAVSQQSVCQPHPGWVFQDDVVARNTNFHDPAKDTKLIYELFDAVEVAGNLERLQQIQQAAQEFFGNLGSVAPSPSIASLAEALADAMANKALSLGCNVVDTDGNSIVSHIEQPQRRQRTRRSKKKRSTKPSDVQ
eukprot:gnl/MRDRNA2_/MRDRNA2_130073_c0_seq1.p1 gnl/MRDRNA2_/MRDRNA2_130073_c0~~gnl/MRDRNA2_/MRDRNA2_130073_c0_seq1.p1  ORF type:complete len:399 (-),score=69.97 gnl/MRDRNA2_/MRDRNA2_130073_c0_seq1:430-1626(-)